MRDDPQRYAMEHAHHLEDIAFWRAAARRLGGPILDLGCAVGRVAIPLAEDGADVWALDGSAEMLDELAARAGRAGAKVAKRIRLVHADMRDFGVDRRFHMVVAAMNTLQTLLTPEDQLACLRTVRAHLAPEGELVFDVALPDLAEVAGTLGVVRHTGVHHDTEKGVTLVHSAWYNGLDPVSQTVSFTIQVDETSADGHVSRHVRHHEVHLFHASELLHLLARAGLEVVESCGAFDGSPVEPGSERQIYRCRAAS